MAPACRSRSGSACSGSCSERGDRADVEASVDGLGSGLSTCRRIVQAHGGRIGIEDSAFGGASVWVLLPAGD
ncbi:ATP-binding protein [Agrococcus sp. TSP3-2-1]|uniref:ATP-binding protein n=1 Tax=Agrococcus sp. TSP3-2-1 TaxID=2804583 RepID=UPI003CFA792D